jgi:hypothetical protein
LRFNHYYCNSCLLDYLKIKQKIEKIEEKNLFQKNKKECNSIKFSRINKKNEDQSNSVQLKQKIEKFLNEKKKVEVVN